MSPQALQLNFMTDITTQLVILSENQLGGGWGGWTVGNEFGEEHSCGKKRDRALSGPIKATQEKCS